MYVELNSILKLCLMSCVLIQGILRMLKGDYVSVHEEKATIVVTHLMDGHTILCIQDVRVFSTKDPLYHFGG
jgi:hypothetical protein